VNNFYLFLYLIDSCLFSEHTSTTVKREFIEEAMNSNPDGAKQIDELFKKSDSVNKIELFNINSFLLDRFTKVILMIREIRVNI